MISCLLQAMSISEKKNSNSADFHEILEAEEKVWMRSCACCCWTFLSAAFTAAAIIIWRVLTCFLKKMSCSDSDVILKKELSYSSLCQIDFFCVEVEIRECCVYNDLFLSRLEVNENFWFMTSKTDEIFVDSWVLNKNWDNCEIFTDWCIVSSYLDDDCLITLNKNLLKCLSRWTFW